MSITQMKMATSVAIVGGMIVAAVSSATAALNLPTMNNCSYMFNTNMKLGSTGTDVMNLQKVLNMYPQTRIGTSGAGSPGLETSYFGAATRAAANKFQALHLVELGITAPTGNVFAGTRGLLNMICKGAPGTNPVPGTPPVSTGPVSAMLAATQPSGMLVAAQSGARLADITFTGSGTVTGIELQRIGISADSALSNVYLYDGNTRITDAASVVTGGFIRFNGSNGLFTVNGSRTITVRADLAGGTSGNSIGVKLNSVTAGGSATTFSNVMGNILQVGSAQVASSTLVMNTGSTPVNAGTVNQIVWSAQDTISTRDVWLRAATFKFVGSAPIDFANNLSLFVDGTKVAGPTMINGGNGNKLTFDLGSTPFVLRTGSHTIDVRGDIVKGTARTYQFSIENVADLMLEDSALSGVNISTYVLTNPLTQSTSAYTTTTISTGSVTVNVDPTFTANRVTGGATNVPVGQFTLKAYGEDVKVNSLRVSFATTTISTLNNVSLYVNGGQIGTSQNFTTASAVAGGLTFTLGSSLIIPAGTTVTLTVKADLVDTNNSAYSSGTVAAVVGGVSSNAQGQNSNELLSVAGSAVTGNVLTISSGSGTFARTSGFTARTYAPNTQGVQIGSFTLQANSAEAIKVNSVSVNPQVATYAITNLSNLTLKTGSTVLGTPIGNPSTGTSTFSFSDITIPANGTITFDVYADIGGATSGTVTADVAVTTRGAISNTTTVSSAAGIAITSSASTLAASSLQSSSPVAQFVVGGSTFGIATYKVSTSGSGTTATVREMRFATTGTDAIQSITVGGVTSTVLGSGATATTTVSGLSIPVGSTGTDIPVIVKFSGFQNTTSGGSLTASIATVRITLSYVEATSGSGTVISTSTQVQSNAMTLVASKPTVTVGSGNTDTLVLGAENKIGEFTVTADANGKISVGSTSLSVSSVGISNIQVSSARVADGNTTITNAVVNGSTTLGVLFNTPYEISAGTSKTFSIFGTVAGAVTSGFSGTPYVTTSFSSSTSFVWYDVIGGNTLENGALIYNFPTNSFTTKR